MRPCWPPRRRQSGRPRPARRTPPGLPLLPGPPRHSDGPLSGPAGPPARPRTAQRPARPSTICQPTCSHPGSRPARAKATHGDRGSQLTASPGFAACHRPPPPSRKHARQAQPTTARACPPDLTTCTTLPRASPTPGTGSPDLNATGNPTCGPTARQTSARPVRTACAGCRPITSTCTRCRTSTRRRPWEEVWQATEQLVREGKEPISSRFPGAGVCDEARRFPVRSQDVCRCGQDIWLFRGRTGTRAGSR